MENRKRFSLEFLHFLVKVFWPSEAPWGISFRANKSVLI